MTPQTLELMKRIRLAEQHPVIGLAALSPGTTLTQTPGLARRAAEVAHASRPDLAREVTRRLEPVKRRCEHCGFMVQKDADRCERCGKFVPSAPKVAKAEFQALVGLPDPGVAGQRISAGAIATHVPTGFVGRVIAIDLDRRAILRDPSGAQLVVPVSEIEALGGVAAQPPPSDETEGGFQGRPATHTPTDLPSDSSYVPMGMRTGQKAVPHGAMSKRTCTNCGAALSDEDIRDGECPECGADLTPDSSAQWGGTGVGGWATTPASKAAFFSSPEGQLQLAKSIRYHRSQPGAIFGRATTNTLRKGGSTLVRGTRVRNRRTGQRGVVLQSNALSAAVEYSDGETTTTALEKTAELERL
jgi:hypothetical protein